MIISLIAAASENNVIGKEGELPWDLPNDLKFFRSTTSGHPVIMGRKTFESIGHPLPKRRNIVITRGTAYEAEGAEIVHSIDDALSLFADDDEEVFIIGGGEVYQQALPLADRVYLTRVHTVIEGDAFFPELDDEGWEEVSSEHHGTDEEHEFAYTFFTFERR